MYCFLYYSASIITADSSAAFEEPAPTPPYLAWCYTVLAMPARPVKARRGPSWLSRDAKVYSHTTTAMHDNGYPPPPPLTICGAFSVLPSRDRCILIANMAPVFSEGLTISHSRDIYNRSCSLFFLSSQLASRRRHFGIVVRVQNCRRIFSLDAKAA